MEIAVLVVGAVAFILAFILIFEAQRQISKDRQYYRDEISTLLQWNCDFVSGANHRGQEAAKKREIELSTVVAKSVADSLQKEDGQDS